jgi:hypothetical protein
MGVNMKAIKKTRDLLMGLALVGILYVFMIMMFILNGEVSNF